MEGKKKNNLPKQRSPNFSREEKFKLVSIIQKHAAILESKETKGPSMERLKDKTWEEVTIEHSKFYSSRTVKNLTLCWNNLKKQARQYKAAEKLEQIKTGGGENEFEKDELLEEVLKIIAIQMKPIPDPKPPKCSLIPKDQAELIMGLIATGRIMDWSKFDRELLKSLVSSPLHVNRIRVDDPQELHSSKNSSSTEKKAVKTKKSVSPSLANKPMKVDDTNSQGEKEQNSSTGEKDNAMERPIVVAANEEHVEIDHISDDESPEVFYQHVEFLEEESLQSEAEQHATFKDNYGETQMVQDFVGKSLMSRNKSDSKENVVPHYHTETLEDKKKKLEVDILEAELEEKKLRINLLIAQIEKEKRILNEM